MGVKLGGEGEDQGQEGDGSSGKMLDPITTFLVYLSRRGGGVRR